MKRTIFAVLAVFLSALAFGQGNGIPKGSKLYIEPNGGFETYLMAAMVQKHVPLTIVMDRSVADYLMSNTTEHGQDPTWSQVWFQGKRQRDERASVLLLDGKTLIVVWAYSVHKVQALRGEQSTAEAVAKHLKDKIRK